jgi:hypothetical protein
LPLPLPLPLPLLLLLLFFLSIPSAARNLLLAREARFTTALSKCFIAFLLPGSPLYSCAESLPGLMVYGDTKEDAELRLNILALSLPSFAAVWKNHEDDVYDAL